MALPLGRHEAAGDADNLGEVLNPPGSGGLLAALHLWRKFQIGGPSHFGEVTYIGHDAAGRARSLGRCAVGTTGGVDCQFMFDSADGTLVAIGNVSADRFRPVRSLFQRLSRIGRTFPAAIASKFATATRCSICSTSRNTICRRDRQMIATITKIARRITLPIGVERRLRFRALPCSRALP